jgi:addiction module RelE/StbE family toxin
MYTVLESKSVVKALAKAPLEVQAKYTIWKSVAQLGGVSALTAASGFKDHGLKGKWLGARSSSLSYQWRVIYTVNNNELEIKVLEVNAHDYR